MDIFILQECPIKHGTDMYTNYNRIVAMLLRNFDLALLASFLLSYLGPAYSNMNTLDKTGLEPGILIMDVK